MRPFSRLFMTIALGLSVMTIRLYSDDTFFSLDTAVNRLAADIVSSLQKAAPQGSTLAVYYFTTDGKRTKLGELLAAELMAALAQAKKPGLTLVSRQKLDEVAAEQSYALSDLTDPAQRVQVGLHLSATHIATGFIFFEKTAVRVTYQVIGLEKNDVVAGSALRVALDKSLESYLAADGSLAGLEPMPAPSPVTIPLPQVTETGTPVPYAWEDSFTAFNRTVWEDVSASDEVTIAARDGQLVFTAPYREGRLNSINTITTKPFKVRSFAFEIAFKDVLASADTISLFVGNVDWRNGNSMQLVANLKKEYYKFAWTDKGDWVYHEDNLKDSLFGDETTAFHRLKLAYDLATKTAYAFVDDILIDKAENLSFLRTDKLHVSVTVSETTSTTGKNLEVVLDDFKSSVVF